MTTQIQPFRQYPRYKVSVLSPSNEKISSNNATATPSDVNLMSSSSKPKKFLWPTLFWIVLGTLIFLALVIAVVVPIAVLANKGDATNTTVSTICPTTAITTTVTASSLPAQCSNYTSITDDTRSPDYTVLSTCDDTIFSTTPMWVRFTGSSGTLIASCPIDTDRCGAAAPGWYSGVYPSWAGSVTSGFVCYNYNGDLCYWTSWILVTNCNGFYVYYLYAPPTCILRYCTI